MQIFLHLGSPLRQEKYRFFFAYGGTNVLFLALKAIFNSVAENIFLSNGTKLRVVIIKIP